MHVTFIKPTIGCLDDGELFVDEARNGAPVPGAACRNDPAWC